QVALSLLLVIGAGLFVKTLRNLQAVDPGFRHEGVLMADVDGRRVIPGGGEASARRAALFREGLDAISKLRGVSAAAVSNFTPISGGYWSGPVHLNGQSVSEEGVVFFAVSPDFFRTLGIPMKTGRDFSRRDDGTGAPVAIVNEELARRLLPGGG